MGLGEAPPRGSAAELFSFGAQLQAALRGLVLTQVYLPTPFERVLKLAFAQRPGEPPSMQLVYECMARYSNLLLVGPDDTVLCAAHQVGTQPAWMQPACSAGRCQPAGWTRTQLRSPFLRPTAHCKPHPASCLQVGQRMSSMRLVQVGGKWEPPPPATGLDPDSCASLDEWRDVLCRLADAAPPDRSPSTLQQVAVRGFRGVSPQLLRDLAQAAGVVPDAAPAELAPEQWQALYEQWQAWLQRLTSSDFAATSCRQSGTYSMLGGSGQQAQQAVEQVLPFLHSYYMAPQEAEQFGGLKQQLTRAVASAIARLQVGGTCARPLPPEDGAAWRDMETAAWCGASPVCLPACLLAFLPVICCRRR